MVKKYRVILSYITSIDVEVEAENENDACKKAELLVETCSDDTYERKIAEGLQHVETYVVEADVN